MNGLGLESTESLGNRLCRMGGTAAWILLAYCLVTLTQIVVLGLPPATAEETFAVLQENRIIGLVRLDLLTVVAMPLYYLLFVGLYTALKRSNLILSALATGLVFVGITLLLTTPSVFSLAHLSDQFASATSDAQRSVYLAAGEAMIASDMWHSTTSLMSGLFVQIAGVLISYVMLQGRVFSTIIGYIGIVAFGLDLAHIIAGLFSAEAGFLLMAIAGPLYLPWFLLVGRRLLELGRTEPKPVSALPIT
ncbi:MAG: hypothetical protein P8020_17705 [Acidobacteriota bacterium]